MKDILAKTILAAMIDIIINVVAYFILKNKYDNIEIIFIISTILMLLMAIAVIYIENKINRFNKKLYQNLKDYTHAQHIQTFTQLSIIQKIFAKNPDISDEYLRDIEGVKRINPLTDKSLDDLFVFNQDSGYKEQIDNHYKYMETKK